VFGINSINNISIDNESINNIFLQTVGGIYIFSESIPSCGTLFNIRALGYLSYENTQRLLSTLMMGTDFNAHFFVMVFRPEADGSYRLVHGPLEYKHQFEPRNQKVEWPVQRGDIVGAIIPRSCSNESRSVDGIRISCPSHIDLRTDSLDCSSALYYPFNTDLGLNSEELRRISEDQFMEVQVHLNMEVEISLTPTDGMKLI
jgi:hypothetical protein